MTDVATALDRSALQLQAGARDKKLSSSLVSLAKSLPNDSGNTITRQRRTALANTLKGIAARLR